MTYILLSFIVLLIASYAITFKSYWNHLKNVAEFRKAYDKYSEEVPDLEKVGTFGGKDFYLFKNPLQLPVKRSEMIELFSQFSDLNMTPDYFRKNIVDLNAALNRQDFTRAGAITQELIHRTELAAHESILLNLAASLTVIEGENPRIPESKYFEEKLNIMKSDEKAKAFFLRFAFATTKNYEKLSESDLLNYLTMQKISNQLRSEQTARYPKVLSALQETSKPQRPSLRTKVSQSKSSSKE